MPVENERKFVLKLDPERILNEIFWSEENERLPDVFIFDQFYLDSCCRIRRSENLIGINILSEAFTYKKEVDGQIIEVETSISSEDFNKLRSIAEKGLSKIRLVSDTSDHTWEIDFFVPTDTEGIPLKERIIYAYLIMAEVELAETETEPTNLPTYIADNLMYRVTEEDNRFASWGLTDPIATRKLYDDLSLER